VGSSLRQLLDSLNREQRRNQELLASLAFALRSFTNLNRFLELVPLVAARLMEAEGALLLPFHADGRLWRDQFHGTPPERSRELLRQLASLDDGQLLATGGEAALAARLDELVGRHWGEGALFGTSVVARSRQRGRLYVFGLPSGLDWSDVHRRHGQLVADLTGVALEQEGLLQDSRRHERLDRQLSTGAEIQAQLLPDHCPESEGVELAARCRPAYLVGGDYYDFIPTRPQLQGRCREQGRWALVMGDVMGKGVPASLLMTLLRGMLRAEVLTGLPPDRILPDLNQDDPEVARYLTQNTLWWVAMSGMDGIRQDKTESAMRARGEAIQGELAGRYADLVVLTEEDERDIDGQVDYRGMTRDAKHPAQMVIAPACAFWVKTPQRPKRSPCAMGALAPMCSVVKARSPSALPFRAA
jgi:hypothetical protein